MMQLPNRTARLILACVLFLFLLLVIPYQLVMAGTQHQTIPTMPPSSTARTTSAPTHTPTSIRQPIQTSLVIPTLTLGVASRTPTSTFTATPSGLAVTTGTYASQTITVLAATYTPSLISGVSPTAPAVPGVTNISGSSFYYLLGGGMLLIILVIIVWLLRPKRKGS